MRGNRINFCMVLLGSLLFSTTVQSDSTKEYTNSIGIELVKVPSGSFMMGSPSGQHVPDDETPQHRVTINKAFYLGKYEVTQAQWEAIMWNNPSKFKGVSQPVENVSWKDVQQFIKNLNTKEGVDRYRLPTEAEWEYAARAGTTTRFHWGDRETTIGLYAWYGDDKGNAKKIPHPVGQKLSNGWGLYDMAGNVWEWCQDEYDGKYYGNSPEADPPGPRGSSGHVIRGGSWSYESTYARPAYRSLDNPGIRHLSVGFRLAMTSP